LLDATKKGEYMNLHKRITEMINLSPLVRGQKQVRGNVEAEYDQQRAREVDSLRLKMLDIVMNNDLEAMFKYALGPQSITLAYGRSTHASNEAKELTLSLDLRPAVPGNLLNIGWGDFRQIRLFSKNELGVDAKSMARVTKLYDTFRIDTLPCRSLVLYPEEFDKPVEINPYRTNQLSAQVLEDLVNRSVSLALDKEYVPLYPNLLVQSRRQSPQDLRWGLVARD